MLSTAQSSPTQRWLVNALALGGLGAVLSYVALWISTLIAGGDGRILQNGPPLGVMFIVCLLLGLLAYPFLKRLWAAPQPCGIIVGWWALYFIVMFASRAIPMSLPIYLVTWLAIGGFGAWMLNASPKARMAGAGGMAAVAAAAVAARQGQEVMRRSDYGRLPAATVVLLTQHVRTANGAAQALPPQAPLGIRNLAVQTVLDSILRDWWENGNREGLTPTDIADMGAFVQLAWQVAGGAPHLAEATAVFKAVLGALMDDWFNAWNADGVDGAPRWQWEARR
ncbi:MAG TPA: hypothetical protein VGE07_26890 [Herpetosiphonaceae bacterium]